MTRLEIQNKLIAKFGNTLNNQDKKRFELFNIKKLVFPAKLIERMPKIEVITGEGENQVTELQCIIGNDAKVHVSMVSNLAVALLRISESDYKNELKGAIACYEPALMPNSETTIAYSSWGLAFRFEQDDDLSENAAKFFTDLGFKLGIDKDNKQYFITDLQKLLKS